MTETLRQQIVETCKDGRVNIVGISKLLSCTTREVEYHLEQIQKSSVNLVVTPAQCLKCGFVFKPKIKKPGKCPQCKSTHISLPWFSILK